MSILTTSQLIEKLNLSELGIRSSSSIQYQPSYEDLYDREMNAPEGFQKELKRRLVRLQLIPESLPVDLRKISMLLKTMFQPIRFGGKIKGQPISRCQYQLGLT